MLTAPCNSSTQPMIRTRSLHRWMWLRRALAGVALGLLVVPALVNANVNALVAAQAGAGGGSGGAGTPAAPTVVPAYRQAHHVAVLTVEGGIDMITLKSLERRMQQARDNGADAVVIDINTPGGEMTAMLDICNLFKDRSDTPANIVAWIHPQAYSAGAIIALACREIVVAPGSIFGDAAPIQIGALGLQSLGPTERAKILSFIEPELLDSARRNHYDENLVQAFVRLTDGLWMLENTRTGERAFVDRSEYRGIFGAEPPPTLANQPIVAPTATAPAGAATQPVRAVVRPAFDTSIPRTSDQAGLSEQDKAGHQAFAQALPTPRAPLTAADRHEWKLVRQVVDDQTLLTVRSDEALYYGLATAVIADDSELLNYFGASTLSRYDESWSEGMVRVLVSWPVRAILIIIFLLALFIEMASPGLGVFGAVAVTALLVLIGAPALAGMADWWEILLIIAGLALVLAEIFVVPGTGFVGIAGVLCLLGGLVATFVAGDITTDQGQSELWTGLLTTLTAIFVSGVGMWLISRQIHSFPVINRLILHTELRSEAAPPPTESGGLLEAMGGGSGAVAAAPALGEIGRAETDLRPAGRATFHGRLFDVQSTGDYIARGSQVRTVSVGRYVIEVEEANA
jgi:membrane-bound serine protease (ClpP class)